MHPHVCWGKCYEPLISLLTQENGKLLVASAPFPLKELQQTGDVEVGTRIEVPTSVGPSMSRGGLHVWG